MTSPSRNMELGAWTQEEYENLFEGLYQNMNVINGYVGSTALPIPLVLPPLQQYSQGAYTDSQPNEEFVSNKEIQLYIPGINFPVLSSSGLITSVPSKSAL